MNHAVTLVGYDKDGDYWIGKNSWGSKNPDGTDGWGEAGYFRVSAEQSKRARAGVLNIYKYAYTPIPQTSST